MNKNKFDTTFNDYFPIFRFSNILKCIYLMVGTMMLFVNTNAQQYNERPEFLKANSVWAFGNKTGLDFNNGSPVGIETAINGMEGFASVSNEQTGKLLFYTNGNRVWNANHEVMPNGSGLYGNGGSVINQANGLISTAQGALILPVIGDAGRYYIFLLTDRLPLPPHTGLYYSIVDMNLDSSRGDVDTNYKNILLNDEVLSEAMIAVPGDSCDIWLILYHHEKPEFYSYRITAEGIDTTPVISTIQSTTKNYESSALTISPDRKKIVLADMGKPVFTLGEFNSANGKITNTFEIPLRRAYVGCFSPDNTKLYFTSNTTDLYQYEVSNFDSLRVKTSEVLIGKVSNLYIPVLKLYRDTIYVNVMYGKTMHRINRPNLSGVACNLELDAISLFPGTSPGARLNSEVVFPIVNETVYTVVDSLLCPSQNLELSVINSQPGYTYQWSTGDTTSKIELSDVGEIKIWVSYGDLCNLFVDTFNFSLNDLFTTVNVENNVLSASGDPFKTYQWYLDGEKIEGATKATFTVTKNGDYAVEVTDEYDCVFLSDPYRVNNATSVKEYDSISHSIRIYPNPATDEIHIDALVAANYVLSSIDGKELMKGKISGSIMIHSLASGIYFLNVFDLEGRLLKTEIVDKQ